MGLLPSSASRTAKRLDLEGESLLDISESALSDLRGRASHLFAAWTIGLGLVVQVPAVLVDHSTHQDLALQAAEIAWPNEEPDWRDPT